MVFLFLCFFNQSHSFFLAFLCDPMMGIGIVGHNKTNESNQACLKRMKFHGEVMDDSCNGFKNFIEQTALTLQEF